METGDDFDGFANNIPPEDFRSGDWLLRLIRYALHMYGKKVSAEYFQNKYPGLPPEAIVDRRISLAKKQAAITGGLSGAAYTGAVAAMGTAVASVVTVPTAITILGADIYKTSIIQLRLAYDISVLYGQPLDYEDPEDLTDLLMLAFGIKAGELFNKSLHRLTPEGVRFFVKKTATGANLRWLKALPVVGKYLLQRNIIKTGIPVVGIGLGAGVNYHYTGKIGQRARKLFRIRTYIEDFVGDFPFHRVQDHGLLLDLLWLAISCDKATTREETRLLREFAAFIVKNRNASDFEDFEKRVLYDKEEILTRLSNCDPEEREVLYKAVCIAAVVDGMPGYVERSFVQEVAYRANIPFDGKSFQDLAMKFK
jgi:hypothetical protein